MRWSANPKHVFSNPLYVMAFGFGSGLSPKAPGTMGTIASIPFYLLLAHMGWAFYGGVVLVAFIFGVYCCGQTAKALGVHDHGGIVWDEFVGFWITMFMVPAGWFWLLFGFALFRFFDIVKPWPIKWLDNSVSGGFGIMIDDVLAGLYALAVLQITALFLPTL